MNSAEMLFKMSRWLIEVENLSHTAAVQQTLSNCKITSQQPNIDYTVLVSIDNSCIVMSQRALMPPFGSLPSMWKIQQSINFKWKLNPSVLFVFFAGGCKQRAKYATLFVPSDICKVFYWLFIGCKMRNNLGLRSHCHYIYCLQNDTKTLVQLIRKQTRNSGELPLSVNPP